MHTTGSRTLFATRPMVIRALLVAIVAAIMIGLPAVFSGNTEAASTSQIGMAAQSPVPGPELAAAPGGPGGEVFPEFCETANPETLAALFALDAFAGVVNDGVAFTTEGGLGEGAPNLAALGDFLDPGAQADVFNQAGVGALFGQDIDGQFDTEGATDIFSTDFCDINFKGLGKFQNLLSPIVKDSIFNQQSAGAAGDSGAAGAPFKYTVDTEVDLPEPGPLVGDGFCDIFGLDGLGPCTLRAAILEANAQAPAPGGVINFDPSLFTPDPQGDKARIVVNQVDPPGPPVPFCGGLGPLPTVLIDDLTIDARDTHVVIDGDCDKDGLDGGDAVVGLSAVALAPNFDFAVLGGESTLEIVNFLVVDIVVCGGGPLCITNSLDEITIDNVDMPGDLTNVILDEPLFGVVVIGQNLNDVELTNNEVEAIILGLGTFAFGGFGPPIIGASLTDNTVDISGNDVRGGFIGVASIFAGNLFSEVVNTINNNEKLSSAGPGIGVLQMFLAASSGLPPPPATLARNTVTFEANDNEEIIGNEFDVGGFGIGAASVAAICCDGSPMVVGTNSDMEFTVERNDNGDVTGNGAFGLGVSVAALNFICCGGSDSTSSISIDGNELLRAQAPGGIGIGALTFNFVCCGDDNTANNSVSTNDRIDANTAGVAIVSFSGDPGITPGADDHVSNVNVDGNGVIVGDDVVGVFIANLSGTLFGLDAENNAANISVSDNVDSIDGGVIGVAALNLAGALIFEGDDNVATANFDNNGPITGQDEFAFFSLGVFVLTAAGGPDVLNLGGTPSSDDNVNNVTFDGNDDLISQEGPALGVISLACCGDDNSNNLSVSENTGVISGQGGLASVSPGIGVLFCCSSNTAVINANDGNISGEGFLTGVGIGILQIDISPFPIFVGLDASNTAVVITDNDDTISESEEQGIALCCGQFFGSVISGNVIQDNGNAGVGLFGTLGVTVGPDNVISGNGSGTGIHVMNIPPLAPLALFPAHYNRFTQNSIYDNEDFGIDLVGFNGIGGSCKPIGIGPNKCLPFPGFGSELIVKDDKLVGGACPDCLVEVFIADNDPDDQDFGVGISGDHGEGRTYVASGNADGSGDFSIELPCGLDSGFLTTTATNTEEIPVVGDVYWTSEFSENVPFAETASCTPPTSTPEDTPTEAPPTDTPTPAPPTDTPTPEPPAALCGDVNLDDLVDSRDANLVLQLKAGFIATVPSENNADVNDSGDITSVDANLILQVDAGFISQTDLTCPVKV